MSALRIFAAGSLRAPFDRLAAGSARALALTYANARDLAQRIEAGALADVFASASEEHPRLLHRAGLADEPRPFATNRLVVAVLQGSPTRDPEVLAAPGTRVAIEVAGIPLGDYTRAAIARWDEIAGPGFARRVLDNVVAEEQVVDAVVACLRAGEADAGVLYATDVVARAASLRAIELPAAAAVAVTYAACATTSTPDALGAARWVDALTEPPARAILRDAGFGPPPSSAH